MRLYGLGVIGSGAATLMMLAATVPCAAAGLPSEGKDAVGALVVATATGKVRGAVADDVASWKGIPFAAPPVGALRWRMPQPARPWSGVREATAFANDCMQLPFGGDAAPLGTPPAEDCLYVNVWRPAGAAAGARLPVILWIYGGGFVNGGSSPPTYSGADLARLGAVVVSFNYRVGRFGTFAHPALDRAAEDGPLHTNFGYMDQIAALRWVRRNIAAFGGAPDNLTVVGESAGGASVHMLLTSPMTQGLVQRAVIMSGGDAAALHNQPTFADAEKAGIAFAEGKGVRSSDADALARLRALPAEQVVDGLNLAHRSDTYVGPVADGKVSVGFGEAYAAGRFSHVPVMVGATSADIGGPSGQMIAGARRFAGALARQGVPVYSYLFSYVAESIGTPGAQHASDIPFFFDTQAIKYGDRTTPRDNTMGRTISAYLVNFARTGDPNGPGLPRWRAYDPGGAARMDFAAPGEAVPGSDGPG